jgi:hypothetical protein
LWGFVKKNVYSPILPRNVDDLLTRITGAVAEVTPDKLRHTWEGFITGGIFVVPHLGVTSNCNSDAPEKI